MTTRQEECECSITEEMAWAGPCIRLCHHTPTEEAIQVRDRLMDILGGFAQQIDPREMFERTIVQMAEEYRKEAAGRLEKHLTREEQAVINVNFLRNLSLSAQMIMCTMIIERHEGE